MLLIFYLCDDVTSWRHVMTSQNLIYLSQLPDVLESWFFFCFHGFLGHWVQKCYWFFICVMTWRHDVMSWRQQNLIYLSQLPDVLESWFFFLFPWFCRSLSSKMLLIFHLCDDVTSWRHVMTSQNLIYLSQLPDVLESWFFFCFHGFLGHWVQKFYWFFSFVWWRDVTTSCHDVTKPDLPISASRCARKLILFLFPWPFRSLSSNMLLIFHLCENVIDFFHLCDDVTSRRHVMTSQNLIYLSQLPDVLESWFFFCFHGFLGHWVQKFYWFFSFVWWRDVTTSCHDVTKPDLPISASRCARKLILFLFPWPFRSLSSNMLLIFHLCENVIDFFHLCDDVTSRRHVMTSQNLIYLSQLPDVLESWFFFCFHGFLGHWVQKCYWFFICVMTWRHDVISWRHKTWFTYLSFQMC